MKIKFYNPETVERNIKVTTHRTGKLGFSAEAAKKFKLSEGRCIQIGINEDDVEDTNLYGSISAESIKGFIKISKAGQYYFINLKPFFDSINLNYRLNTYIFDITEENIENQNLLVFKRRIVDKKKNGIEL